MKVKVGDKVRILAGKDKGKEGIVSATLKKDNKVVVNGINVVKRHMKPNAFNAEGGIIEKEAPIHASNVMIMDPKTNKPTRIGHSVNKDGKKIRVTKKSNSSLD